MSNDVSSILVVSKNQSFASAIEGFLAGNTSFDVETQGATIAGLNGSAVHMAKRNDLVVFEAYPDDPGEMASIAKVVAESAPNTHFVAIADRDITLSEARALTRLGIEEVLPPTISEAELVAALDEVVSKSALSTQPQNAPTRGRLISVSKSRGGVGGTTLAVNLACNLAAENRGSRNKVSRQVALVDFDLQFGNVGDFLDLGNSTSFASLIAEEQIPDDTYLSGIMARHESGVDVLTAPDTALPLHSFSPTQVSAILDLLTIAYDYVVVDLPQALVDWTEPVVQKSDLMLVATDTAVPTLRYARRLIDLFREDNPTLEIELVVCGEKKPRLRSELLREGEKFLRTELKTWVPHDPKHARRAIDIGVPLACSNKRSPLKSALLNMTGAVRQRLEMINSNERGEPSNVS